MLIFVLAYIILLIVRGNKDVFLSLRCDFSEALVKHYGYNWLHVSQEWQQVKYNAQALLRKISVSPGV